MNTSFSTACLRLACAVALLCGARAEADTWFNAVVTVFPSSTVFSTANPTLIFGVDSSTPHTSIGTPGGGPGDPPGGVGGALETVYFQPGTDALQTDIRAGTDNLQWILIAKSIGTGGASITWPAGLGTNTTNAAFMTTSSGTRTLTLSNGSGMSVNMLTTTSATLTSGTYSIAFGLNLNNAPITQLDAAPALTGVLTTINPLTNDRDPDAGDTLTIAGIQYLGQTVTATSASLATEHGTASINGDRQSISYTSTAGYTGIDSFQYQAADNHGAPSPWTDIAVTVASAYGTHTCPAYVTQGTDLTVGMQLFYTGSHSSISVVELIPMPTGTVDFAYAVGSLSTTPATPAWIATTSGSYITFTPSSGMPPSGVTLSYNLSIDKTEPAGVLKTITAGTISLDGNPVATLPDTSFTVSGLYHSADTNKNWKIELTEIPRVIDLYKGNGYHTDATTADGFAPGAGTIISGFHSADTNKNGKIELTEIPRVIDLYKANGYHQDSSTADGYAPGPSP